MKHYVKKDSFAFKIKNKLIIIKKNKEFIIPFHDGNLDIKKETNELTCDNIEITNLLMEGGVLSKTPPSQSSTIDIQKEVIITKDFLSPEVMKELIKSPNSIILYPTKLNPQFIYPTKNESSLDIYKRAHLKTLKNNPIRKYLHDKGVLISIENEICNLSLSLLKRRGNYGWGYINTLKEEKNEEKQIRKTLPSDKIINFNAGSRIRTIDETLDQINSILDPIFGFVKFHDKYKNETGNNKTYFTTFSENPIEPSSFALENFYYTAMGKGISDKQSKLSSLCEAIERYSSLFVEGDFYTFKKGTELDGKVILPSKLTPYSIKQYIKFKSRMSNYNQSIYETLEYDNQKIAWTKCKDINHNEYWIPLEFIYKNTPFDSKYVKYFHNGGACGNSLDEALLQALLELIERDAVAIWWYNKLNMPKSSTSDVCKKLLSQVNTQISGSFDYWLIDITNDINIPVIAAVAMSKIKKEVVLSFGCHLNISTAKERALTELIQVIEIKDINTSPFSFSNIPIESFLFGSKPSYKTTEIHNYIHLSKALNIVHDKLKICEINFYYVDQTREELPLHAVKAVAPGLCHLFPYFSAERLYKVPVKIGFLDKEKEEDDFNKVELLI
ncbi:hypothetical protein CWC18_13685 [Pseudoalteromonas aurantia]|uniref:YcaO-like family protein n=1 Tax=Pseudoalteromonas aurantia TaxID=43654 RepID=UPI00110ABA0B|nr:YcaO-like family protein [Pseudoalteromonas aurantia]TMO60459.1 hypothetical protein CWC18_13685 [Pseudoalteromonas aurantia]